MSLWNEYKRDISASAYPEYHIQYQPSYPLRGLPFLAHVNNSRQYFNCAPVIRGLSRLFYHSSTLSPSLPPPSPLCFSSLSWVTSGNTVDRVDTTLPLYIPGWLGRSVVHKVMVVVVVVVLERSPRDMVYAIHGNGFIFLLNTWTFGIGRRWWGERCYERWVFWGIRGGGLRMGETILKVERWFGCEINSRE